MIEVPESFFMRVASAQHRRYKNTDIEETSTWPVAKKLFDPRRGKRGVF
jgi:hypothetical protein